MIEEGGLVSGRDVVGEEEECLRRGRVREDMAKVGRRWGDGGEGRRTHCGKLGRIVREKEIMLMGRMRRGGNLHLFSSQTLLLLSCLLLPGTVAGRNNFEYVDVKL